MAESRKIIDINKHGIRREMYAAGNKTVSKLNKKNKKKNEKYKKKF